MTIGAGAVVACDSDWSLGTGTVQHGVLAGSTNALDFARNSSVVATTSIRGLAEHLRVVGLFDCAYIDRARAPDLSNRQQWREWVHGTRALLSVAHSSLNLNGMAVIHIDSRDLVTVLRLAVQSSLHLVETLAWGKKYSGQQVSRTVEPLHDLILIFKHIPQESPIAATFLPWRVVGKSEDAVREFRDLLAQSSIQGLAAPPPLKPRGLYAWLMRERLADARRILDLTSCGGSVSEHVDADSVATVDVLWADTDWRESTAFLLAQRLSLDATAVVGLMDATAAPKSDCSCLFGVPRRPVSDSRNARVRVRPLQSAGDPPRIFGAAPALARVLERFFLGSVDLARCSVSDASDFVEAIRESLTITGLAVIDLGGEWESHLLEAAEVLGPEVEFGQLITPETLDAVCSMRMSLVFMREGVLSMAVGPERLSPTYVNADDDPRGGWRDPGHKGAKSGGPGTSFVFNWPPYRWRLVDGDFPKGLWRLSPETGVIWGVAEEAGEFDVIVGVVDSVGATAQNRLRISVGPTEDLAPGSVRDFESVWWISEPPEADGPLRILTTRLQMSRGAETSRTLRAAGGVPTKLVVEPPGKPLERGRSRYWEFSRDTFHLALQRDAAIFPARIGARPRVKKYEETDDRPRRSSIPSVLPPSTHEDGPTASLWRLLSAAGNGAVLLGVEVANHGSEIRFIGDSESPSCWEAYTCDECSELSAREDGCSAGHAVQEVAGLVITVEGVETSAVDLSNLDGRVRGLLIPEQPVTEESLRFILASRNQRENARVLARRRAQVAGVSSRVEIVSWLK